MMNIHEILLDIHALDEELLRIEHLAGYRVLVARKWVGPVSAAERVRFCSPIAGGTDREALSCRSLAFNRKSCACSPPIVTRKAMLPGVRRSVVIGRGG